MRVLVNTLAAAGPRTGVGHYTAELVRCLDHQAGEGEEVVTFPGPWVCRARALAVWARSRLARRGGRPTGPPGAPGWRGRAAGWVRAVAERWQTRAFRAACDRGRVDLYHEPNFLPLPTDLPTIATFPDLSLLRPQWHLPDRVAHFERRLRRVLAQCTHILAISEFARQEIIGTLGLPPERVTRTYIYMGVRPAFRPLTEEAIRPALARLGLGPGYLLYVGTIEPRKNVLTLLRAYCALPAALRGRHPLVLAGGWGWGAADVAAYLDAEGRARGVRHLGYVPDALLPALYNGARALAYPSLYEGFGLPPVEMLACGGAVLASTAGAVAETAGAAAHLVEPLDADGWRQALARVCGDDGWRQALRAGACRAARPYTWQRCAADTLDAYRKLAGKAERQPRAAA
jgi:alpha-1,3-rhamnosyl/mannosyltransferase